MLNMVAPYRPAFAYNETSGSSQNLGTGHSSYGKYEGASFALSFVGTGYSLNGTLSEPDGSAYHFVPGRPVGFNNVSTIASQLTATLTGPESLGSTSSLPPAAYQVRATFESDVVIDFFNSTIDIPVVLKERQV